MADYLYNGVRLPDINTVWTDEETYPYAYISDMPGYANTGEAYYLWLSDSPTMILSGGSRAFTNDAKVATYLILLDINLAMSADVNANTWIVMQEQNYEAEFPTDSNPTRWTSHDILNSDGTVYLAASEPELAPAVAHPIVFYDYFYNDTTLFDINTVWTDELKATYPYAYVQGGAISDDLISTINNLGYDIKSGAFYACALTSANVVYNGTDVVILSGTEELGFLSFNDSELARFYSDGDIIDYSYGSWFDAGTNSYDTDTVIGDLIWTSHDILNSTDNTVYLATSDPVAVRAYLYSGVELPILPDWDQETYPYATVVVSETFTGLYFTTTPYSIIATDDGKYGIINRSEMTATVYKPQDDAWSIIASDMTLEAGESAGSIDGWTVWTNYDLLNSDGTVYQAASNPIPVAATDTDTETETETPTITSITLTSPDSVTQGEEITITATVAGTGEFSTACTAALSGNSSSSTTLTESDTAGTYILACASDETATTLTVTVTSAADSSVSAAKTISVEIAVAITSISITSPDSVTQGEEITIVTAVEGTGDFDDARTVSLSGNISSATTLVESDTSGAYILACASDETATTLTVTATSTADASITTSKTISVEPAPVVTSITIESPDEVITGRDITITITVAGEGDFDSTCTTVVSGGTSSNTVLTETDVNNIYTLTCGSDETATELTVTVTSASDVAITATKTISVIPIVATIDYRGLQISIAIGLCLKGWYRADDITDAELIDGVLYIRNASAVLNGEVLEVI